MGSSQENQIKSRDIIKYTKNRYFLKIQYRIQFVNKLKNIKNAMEFFSYYLSHFSFLNL